MARVSSGTLTILVFAVLAGLGGAYFVRQSMRQQPALPPLPGSQPDDVLVPVAANDLQPGQMLTQNDIAVIRIRPDEFAKSKYVNLPYMRATTQIQDRILRSEVKRGEAFLTTFFYPDGAGPGIADLLENGYRAVTVAIHDVGAVVGFARPGTFVDVLFRSVATEDRPEVTITLLERVKVLAINKNTLADRNVEIKDEGRVTLSVTPMQAKVLKVVEGRGEMSLALRNPKEELDSMPVEFGPLGPLGQTDHLGQAAGAGGSEVLRLMAQGAAAGRNVGPNGLMPTAGMMSTDLNVGGSFRYGSERVLSGTDQISLDDLLGTPPKPVPVKMVIFRGSEKEVVEFEDSAPPPASHRLINRPTISTPLVGPRRPLGYPRRMQTVQTAEPAPIDG
jgi:Flp pilus assembly protein CpaB